MDIGACWISGLNALLNGEEGEKYKKKLNLADNQIPQLAISLGFTESKPEKPYPRKEGKYQFIR